jgi:hypothetical protein
MAQGPNAPYTKLDQNHITQRVFDENTDRLRVDAEVTASIGEVIIEAEDSNIAIKDPSNGNVLHINADGSIDSNVVVDATQNDSIVVVGTEDGTIPGTKHALRVDQQGYQQTLQMNVLVPFKYDSIYPSYPSPTTEIYVYKQSASTVATVTVIYTDSSKSDLVSIVRT